MARGFGATHGVADTDRITGPGISISGQITVLVRFVQHGSGGGGFGRILQIPTGQFDCINLNSAQLGVGPNNADANTYWRWNRPVLGTPTSLGVSTVLSGSSAPYVVQNNVEQIPGVVTLAAWSAVSGQPRIGNRSDNIRIWDGSIQDVAIYDAILTPGEHMEFQRGVSPLKIRPQNLLHYLPLDSDPRIDLAGAHSLWTPTGTAYRDGQVFPHVQPRRQSVFLPSWLSGGGPPSPSPLAVFRNHYINQGIA